MKSRRWIILGIVLMLIAFVILILGGVFSISRFKMQQVLMPGSVEFTMDSPGPFYLAYEPSTYLNGSWFVSSEEPSITFSLESLDGAGTATIEPPTVPANYSFGGRNGQYIGEADLKAGAWRLTGVSMPGDDQSAVYAYGHTPISAIFIPVLITALAAALIGPVGLGLLIVGIILHVQAGKQKRVASQAPTEG